MIGQRSDSGTIVEFLLLRRESLHEWEVLVKPGRRCRVGHSVTFIPGELEAEILDVLPNGNRRVCFHYTGLWEDLLKHAGHVPLPPYIHETLSDDERYQTVYANVEGSAAAPTAGLHFTPRLLEELKQTGIGIAEVTLHVGLDTFRPVREENIDDHVMHREFFEVGEQAAQQINAAKSLGHRVIAVGTTSCRVLESVGRAGCVQPGSGWTDLFIKPGYTFRIINGLITNFHLPESSLLMLVSALCGRERILSAYRAAVARNYRF